MSRGADVEPGNESHERCSISVIVPVFNEDRSVRACYEQITEILEAWGRRYELILVNDGSHDGTGRILDELAAADSRVVVIHFRRNYGQTAAVTAGMDHARGGVLIPIDADMQNDPADIPALVAKLETGYDVVSGWRKHRRDGLTRVLLSRCANWIISVVSGVPLHDYGCSLKAYRREVVDGLRLYGEMHRFIPIYAYMNGGKTAEMEVNHRPRVHGRSNYGLARIFKVVLDLILVKYLLSYSAKPIYVFGGFGLFCLTASAASIMLAVYFKFAPGSLQKDFVETPLPVVAAVLILVGFLALLQGLLAEILMRTYFESQGKRPYLVERIHRSHINS